MWWLLPLALASPDDPALVLPDDLEVAGATAYELSDQRCVVLWHQTAMMYVHGGRISVTHDRGRTWTDAGTFQGVVDEAWRLDADTAFLQWEWQIEGVYPGLLFTTDGGRTWTETPLDTAARRTGECCFQSASAVEAKDASTFSVELTDYGRIETHDAGKTWTDVPKRTFPNALTPLTAGSWCQSTTADGQVTLKVKDATWRTVVQVPQSEP